MKYGQIDIENFDINSKDNIWPNEHKKNYTIKIDLPEFMCRCPRSGYPDFAKISLTYVPDKFVVELKALKLYINSFANRSISHENSINEIFDSLSQMLKPKSIKIIGDFNPRGNVHTIIEIDSKDN
jgi:7-cyano-7-deazaguanine reductase